MNSIWVIIHVMVNMDFAFIGANPETRITHTFASYELCEEYLMERFKLDIDIFERNLMGRQIVQNTTKELLTLGFMEYVPNSGVRHIWQNDEGLWH